MLNIVNVLHIKLMKKYTLNTLSATIIILAFFAFSHTASAATLGVSPQVMGPTTCSVGLSCGLVGYWTFDGKDMAGGKALDRSGRGNHGSPVNIATSTFYTSGKIGQGLKFDGVDDKVTVPLTATLNPSSITVAFWANVPSYIGSKIGRAHV